MTAFALFLTYMAGIATAVIVLNANGVARRWHRGRSIPRARVRLLESQSVTGPWQPNRRRT